MIHEFDILVLDGGNLVISDDLNILRNTLQISLSVIVLNEEDIDHIFAPKMTELHGLLKNVHNFYPGLSGR